MRHRVLYFNTVKWLIFPCSLIPIIFNILTLLGQTSMRTTYQQQTYIIRLDFQRADLSKVIHFRDNSTEGLAFVNSIPMNEKIRRSYSFAMLGYCFGTLSDFNEDSEEYHVEQCHGPNIHYGFPLKIEMQRVFEVYVLPSFPTAYFEFPEEFESRLQKFQNLYKAMSALSIIAILFSSLSSVTYLFSLSLVSHTFVVGAAASLISTTVLLCNAVISLAVNKSIGDRFTGIDESFEVDYGEVTFVFNWLCVAFQGLVVVLLSTLWAIRMRTFKKGVKFSFNDVLGSEQNGKDMKEVAEEPVKIKFTDALNTKNTGERVWT